MFTSSVQKIIVRIRGLANLLMPAFDNSGIQNCQFHSETAICMNKKE